MKTLVSLLVFIVVSIGNVSYSAGIEKMFVHRSAGDKSLFFIFSQTLPGCKETRSLTKSMDYDYTYLQKTDSVTMLLTLPLQSRATGLLAKITTDKESYIFEPELIYAEPRKGKIIYRLRLNMPFDTFVEMYSSTDPFIVSFNYDCSGREENLCFSYDKKKWLDNKEKLLSIIDLIKLNTGKK